MHSAVAPPPPPPLSSVDNLHQTTTLLSAILPASSSVNSFPARWQIIRTKLVVLSSSLSSISDSIHWSENHVLQTLFPDLLSTLSHIQTLCYQCTDFSYKAGKLLMQSDLDIAAGWLSKQLQDLDLLIRSEVLCHSTAIVLSQPVLGCSSEDLGFFLLEMFSLDYRLGEWRLRVAPMECLVQLLIEDEKAVKVVANEGNLRYLIQLLDVTGYSEQAVSAVSILACAGEESRKMVFEEGGLGPLLRILESGSVQLKEKASITVEAITGGVDINFALRLT